MNKQYRRAVQEIVIPTLSFGGRRHRGRRLWLQQVGEGRRRLGESFSRGDGRKTFLNFIESLRMSSLKEIRELLVYFYISDEKFVPLYDEI